MTDLQRAQLRASEIRSRLNELGLVEDLTDEQRSEVDSLAAEYQTVEARIRALTVAADGDGDGDGGTQNRDANLDPLIERANLGAYFEAAIAQRSVDGAELELQQEFDLAANQVPLAMLEERAVTPAPTSTAASQQPILQPIFATGDAAFLGVAMPTVPVGDAVYPVLTNRPTVGGPHTDSTAVDETTGAFTAEVLAPKRLQASFFYRRTDAARFRGMGPALRQALSNGLSEALDKELIDQIVADVNRTDATAENTFATYRKALVYDRIDGRFASMESAVKLLVGSDTLAHMSTKYRSNTADDSAVDSLRRITSGVRVSPHIADVASKKQDAIVRRGLRRDAVAPIWNGITLIPDEVTKAGTGEIVITAVVLANWKVVRTGGFARIQTQHG